MKRTFCLVLILALIIAMSSTALAAAPDVAETHACSHTWGPTTTSTIWSNYNSSQCKKTDITTKVCTKCAKVDQQESVSYPYHGTYLSSASCNGTTQTWIYSCPNCGAYRYTDWYTCPGAGKSHAGGCQWLPM